MPVIEAMACGVFVIATMCGVSPELPVLHVPIYDSADDARRLVPQIADVIINGGFDYNSQFLRGVIIDRLSWRHLAADWCRAIAGESV